MGVSCRLHRTLGIAMTLRRWLLRLPIVAALVAAGAVHAQALLDFTAAERAAILAHGPWPQPAQRDPTNRLSGHAAAIEFGELLFLDKRLSGSGRVACATCHQPERLWIDGEKRAFGRTRVDRNTPTLADVRLHRAFGWSGAADSLWAQSIRPILDARELAADAEHVAKLIRSDTDFACRFERATGAKPEAVDAERVLVDTGKALAAFVETLGSNPAPFDGFRDALARGDERTAAARFSPAAQRGLRLFIGKANCVQCHSGPNFSSGEFRRTGVPLAIDAERVDAGRFDSLRELLRSRFNLLSKYNDAPAAPAAAATKETSVRDRDWGRFRVPSLRNTVLTAPYMHNGHFASLSEVVEYYSELKTVGEYPNPDPLLQPLKLSAQEKNDLVLFLESLTSFSLSWRPGTFAGCAK